VVVGTVGKSRRVKDAGPLINIHLSRQNSGRWGMKREGREHGERVERSKELDVALEGKRARVALRNHRVVQCTPQQKWPAVGTFARKWSKTGETWARTSEKSAPTVGTARRRDTIRQEIIGHSLRRSSRRVAGRNLWSGRLETLVDKPTGQHCADVFLKPGIQQVANLFTQIRGVAETGQLVRLQGIAGSSEKKLPRRLSSVFGHGDAPKINRF